MLDAPPVLLMAERGKSKVEKQLEEFHREKATKHLVVLIISVVIMVLMLLVVVCLAISQLGIYGPSPNI